MTENKNTTESTNPDEPVWEDCAAGEISGMVSRIARRRRLAVLSRVSAVTVVLLAAVGIWQFDPGVIPHPTTPKAVAEIHCSDVIRYASAFQSGELDEDLTAQVQLHLTKCSHCDKELKKLAEKSHSSLEMAPQGPRHPTIFVVSQSSMSRGFR